MIVSNEHYYFWLYTTGLFTLFQCLTLSYGLRQVLETAGVMPCLRPTFIKNVLFLRTYQC